MAFSEETFVLATQKSKAYTDQVIQGIGKGMTFKGFVDYYSDLPSNAELGDMYTVNYQGTSGTFPSGEEYVWVKDGPNTKWELLSGSVFRWGTMPTATADYENKIYQFIGTSTTDYTQGYFYICTKNTDNTYSWKQMNVQPALPTEITLDCGDIG